MDKDVGEVGPTERQGLKERPGKSKSEEPSLRRKGPLVQDGGSHRNLQLREKERTYQVQWKQEECLRGRTEREAPLEEQNTELTRELGSKEKYSKLLERMQKTKEQRVRKREELKEKESQSKKFLSERPLYEKIQENYYNQVELPALTNRRIALEKHRQAYISIGSSEMEKHTKWYSQLKEQRSHKSRPVAPKLTLSPAAQLCTKLGKYLFINDRNHLKAEKQAHEERLSLVKKQSLYSNLVRDMFSPDIDKFKQQELKLRIEKLKNPLRKSQTIPPKRNSRTHRKYTEESDYRLGFEWKSRKYPKNPLILETPTKREPKTLDYLAEIRKPRDFIRNNMKNIEETVNKELSSDIPKTEKLSKIEDFTRKIDRDIIRKEGLLTGAASTDVTAIQQADSLNELLITNIRAKISVLDHLSNN